MKNNYQFEYLIKSELPNGVDESSIFFAMHRLSMESQKTRCLAIDDFESLLTEGEFYVAHNVIAYKGKTKTFRGKLVLAKKSDLIDFLKHATTCNDLRPLLISPRFSVTPEQVILISEDECHLYLCT